MFCFFFCVRALEGHTGNLFFLNDLKDADFEADHIVIDKAKQEFSFWNFVLRLPNSDLFFIRGYNLHCLNNLCLMNNVIVRICPHFCSNVVVKADQLVLYPSGSYDIKSLSFWFGQKRFFKLPWVHIRPHTQPGFAMPKLAYEADAGLIAGPGGYIPLRHGGSLTGLIAVRSRQGFESYNYLQTDDLNLRIDHLFINFKHLFRLRFLTVQKSKYGYLGADFDWLSQDRRIVDYPAADYLERVTTGTVSRFLATSASDLLIAEASLKLFQEIKDTYLYTQIPRHIFNPAFHYEKISISLPSISIGNKMNISANTEFVHWGDFMNNETISNDSLPPHSRLITTFEISKIFKTGFMLWQIDTALRRQMWFLDNSSTSKHLTLGGASIEVFIPLFREYRKNFHTVTPFIRYRITPLVQGDFPSFATDYNDLIRQGHGYEAGFTTSIYKKNIQIFQAEFFERMAFRGYGNTGGISYFTGRTNWGPPNSRISLDSTWDQQNKTLSAVGGHFHRTEKYSNIDIAIRMISSGNGPDRDRPFSTSFLPWFTDSLPVADTKIVEIFQQGVIPLNTYINIFGGIRANLYPSLTFHTAWYGIKLSTKCKCFSINVTASHKMLQFIPDIYSNISIYGL